MNYYIKGNAAKAEQIRAAFEAKGCVMHTGMQCDLSDMIYFSLNGKVGGIKLRNLDLFKTHPDYQELELPVEFKNGDIIGFNDCTHNDGSYVDWVGIYKRKRDDSLNKNQHLFHCVVTSMDTFRTGGSWRVFTAYPATKEQRGLLFSKMKEAGYEWDEKKKELRKIQPHYDIANFQPKQWVLARDTSEWDWELTMFAYLNSDGGSKFTCINGVTFKQCIPFDEKTKHLLGTTDMPSEEYINW